MQNVRRRLHLLERLPQFQLLPSPVDQIRNLALQSLSQRDLELLRAILLEKSAEMRSRGLSSQCEAAACAAWRDALEAEARRMGFKSFAEAERTAGQRL
jgi:hypothetical protein